MRATTIGGTSIKDCINAGYTQHVALFFRGTPQAAPFEIIGDERVAVDNGFTLHEYYNQDTNIAPGSVCTPTFEATLLNDDAALTGFNYDREFMLLLGVEKNQGEVVTVAGSYNAPENLVLNGIGVSLKGRQLNFGATDTSIVYVSSDYRHIFAIKGRTTYDNGAYYLYVVSQNGSSKYIDEVYRIAAGSGLSSQVELVRTSNVLVSDYFFARLEALASYGACEAWDFNDSNGPICEKFISNSGRIATKRTILYEPMCMLIGKKPRRTLGKIVTLTAMGETSKLDKNADEYADHEFTSPQTLKAIRSDILSEAGLFSESTTAPGETRSFATNPFAGMHGYTYREFLSYLGQVTGRSLCEKRALYVGVTEAGGYNVPTYTGFTYSYGFFMSLKTTVNAARTFAQDEYYTYDSEEYTVTPVQVLISKQSDTDIGVSYPENPSGTNTLYFLNNPILVSTDAGVIRSILSYAYNELSGNGSGNYAPSIIECPSRLYIEPGDVIGLTLETGTTVRVPVFAMTTAWNGHADCVIECTGDETIDQYKLKDFRKTIKDGAKVHELIVDIDRVYSSIMNTLTGEYCTIEQTENMINTEIGDALGNYYTKNETASLITTEMSDALGNYYTKNETATLVETKMSDALGNYSTTQQTSSMISTYVGNNAYTKASGITINANGVSVTGNKYIELESNGDWVKLGDASAGSLGVGLALAGRYKISLVPAGGVRGWLEVTYDQDSHRSYSINLMPHAMYSSGGQLYEMNSSLGGDGNPATDRWSDAFIETIYYDNAYENSSRDVKHDIESLPEMGSLIDQLRPVSFIYNHDKEERTRYGLIHEEAVGIMPVICKGAEWDDAKKKAIDYVELVPVLLREIQSLRARVKELESKNVQT